MSHDELTANMLAMGERAAQAARQLSVTPRHVKDAFLQDTAKRLREQADMILAANEKDLTIARGQNLADARLDRIA